MNHPSNYKYAATHEWAIVEGDVVVSGICDFAQDALGDLVYIELPEVGRVYQQGEQIGVVESVKTASDIHAPVTGTVIAVNEALLEDADIINDDPYNKGWIYKLKPDNMAQLDSLLSAAEYMAQNNIA